MADLASTLIRQTGGIEAFPGMSLLRGAYEIATNGELRPASMAQAFSKHLSSFADPKMAIAELKKFAPVIDSIGKMKLNDMLGEIEKADPEFQKAFQVSLSNPKFLEHLQKGGTSAFMNPETLGDLLTNPERSMERGFATQLLTQIGTNPMFKGDQTEKKSFERLDKLGVEVKALGEQYKKLDELKTKKASEKEIQEQQDRILKQQLAMADDLRQLGVNVPSDVSPEIMEAFMNILRGQPTADAMDELMLKLADKGISPEAIKSLDNLMRPMAGLMDYIAGPYAEFIQKHGSTFSNMANNVSTDVQIVADGIFNGQGITSDPAQIAANRAKISSEIDARRNPQDIVSAEGQKELDAGHKPVEIKKAEGMEGVDKRIDLAATFGLKERGITPDGRPNYEVNGPQLAAVRQPQFAYGMN